jgi:DNA-binding CsgD family transcriptional regulator
MTNQPNNGFVSKHLSAEQLTPRELDVLCWFVRGCSNSEIASELHLSERTVYGHLSSIREKLDVKNRADLLKYIRENGIGC